MSRIDDPVSCFRCYDMKVIDPVALDSIADVLRDAYKEIEGLSEDVYFEHGSYEVYQPPPILERIHRHIILLESLPENSEAG